jgi:nitrile hydratase
MTRRVHDQGGWPGADHVNRSNHEPSHLEKETDALFVALATKGLMRVDELRRGIESIEPGLYEELGYYDRWMVAIERLMIEKGVLTKEGIDRRMAELDE